MSSASDIRKGLTIKLNEGVFSVIEFLPVKATKGASTYKTKLKNLATRQTLEKTFVAGERIDIVRVESREYKFLSKDESGVHLANVESNEQISVDENLIEGAGLLQKEQIVTILFDSNNEVVICAEIQTN